MSDLLQRVKNLHLTQNVMGINKKYLDEKIANLKVTGVSHKKRTPKLIVSLTSFPERMYDIHYCLFSLLTQSVKPDKIILWLGQDEFLNKEKDLPKEVLRLKDFGLSIEFTKDIKSYTKLLPALEKYPNDLIVTADDDIFYPQKWLEKLYGEYLKDNTCVMCHRAHKIKFDVNGQILPYKNWEQEIKDNSASFLNFLTGVGGVLYPPNSFYKDISDEKKFNTLTPNADDIWLWSMLVLNNKKIKSIENPMNKLTYINLQRERGLLNEKTLSSTNILENDIQLKNVMNEYPQILEILQKENSK